MQDRLRRSIPNQLGWTDNSTINLYQRFSFDLSLLSGTRIVKLQKLGVGNALTDHKADTAPIVQMV
jgi:hypothetical protein